MIITFRIDAHFMLIAIRNSLISMPLYIGLRLFWIRISMILIITVKTLPNFMNVHLNVTRHF